MKRKLIALAATVTLSGCITSIKTPSGASYLNVGFTKSFSELSIKGAKDGPYEAQVKNWKSDGAQATALAAEALKRIPVVVP